MYATILIKDRHSFDILFDTAMARPKDWHDVLNATVSTYKKVLIAFSSAFVASLLICLVVIFAGGNSAKKSNNLSGIVMIGGYDDTLGIFDNNADIRTFELYHPSTASSNRFTNLSMLQKRSGHVAVVLDNNIIYATGFKFFHTSYIVNTSEILDLNTFTITQGPFLHEARSFAGGALFKNTFVICGGQGNSYSALASCEQLIRDKWKSFTPLPEPRQGLQMVNVNGQLLALGGGPYFFGFAFSSVHEWRPESNNWVRKADMNMARAYFGATAFENSIIACGGRFIIHPFGTDTCEQYDMRMNRWEYIASMNERRYYMSLVAFEESLYVLGGTMYYGGVRLSESYVSVERYLNGNWSFVADLKTPRAVYATVVVRK